MRMRALLAPCALLPAARAVYQAHGMQALY